MSHVDDSAHMHVFAYTHDDNQGTNEDNYVTKF